MNRHQLEMCLDRVTPVRLSPRRGRRLARARWWFDQMRQAVDDALEPASASAPETSPSPAR